MDGGGGGLGASGVGSFHPTATAQLGTELGTYDCRRIISVWYLRNSWNSFQLLSEPGVQWEMWMKNCTL